MKVYLPKSAIEGVRKVRPSEYLDELQAAGKDVGTCLEFESDYILAIKQKHGIKDCPKIQEPALSDPRKPLLGDMLEAAAKPIAKALNLPCLNADGSLKEDSGCAKRRDFINAAHEAVNRAIGIS